MEYLEYLSYILKLLILGLYAVFGLHCQSIWQSLFKALRILMHKVNAFCVLFGIVRLKSADKSCQNRWSMLFKGIVEGFPRDGWVGDQSERQELNSRNQDVRSFRQTQKNLPQNYKLMRKIFSVDPLRINNSNLFSGMECCGGLERSSYYILIKWQLY